MWFVPFLSVLSKVLEINILINRYCISYININFE